MSYCRWSTDDYGCDLYVYADTHGGVVSHVASRRRVFAEPLPPKLGPIPTDPAGIERWIDAYVKRALEVQTALDRAELVPIEHEKAGSWAHHATAGEAADYLEELIAEGFRIPLGVIEELREDHAEAQVLKSRAGGGDHG